MNINEALEILNTQNWGSDRYYEALEFLTIELGRHKEWIKANERAKQEASQKKIDEVQPLDISK